MANGRDRNPFDDDYDMRPGGRGDSPEFARKYDPQGEREYTNLPSNQAQIELAYAERNADRAQREMAEGSHGRIHFWPNVGKFIIPIENTFAAHLQLVQRSTGIDLHFDPDTYRFFDRVIAQTANRPDIFDPSSPTYAHYRPLRENLAALRNDIMGIYMDDGSFDPGDEKFIPHLISIATELGQGINNEKRMLPRLFAPSLDTELLNMHGDGAAYAYRHLEKLQRTRGMLSSVISDIRSWLGMPVREWDLPPVEYTAFSEDALNKRPPADPICMTEAELAEFMKGRAPAQQQEIPEEAKGDVEEISFTEKEEASKHGVIILRWLKNIKFNDKSLDAVLKDGTEDDRKELRGIVAHVVQLYEGLMANMLTRNPALAQSEQVQAGNESAKVLKHSIELLAKLEKPKSIADTMSVGMDETRQPEKWNELAGRSVDRLMATLKGALESAFGAMEQQVDDQQRQQEEATEQVQDSLLSADALKRKKKRQKTQAKKTAQVNAFNQRRNANDVNGDGIADKFQGIANVREPIKVAEAPAKLDQLLKGLGVADMAALKNLANGNGDPAKKADGGGGLSGLAVTDASLNDKLAPDDIDIATKIIDQRKREQQKGGPKTTI